MKQLSPETLDEFLGEFRADRRVVEYVKLMMQWAEIAEKFGKLFMAQGGFAVELAAGKITRTHDDLDILVSPADIEWFKERFQVDGYKIKYHEGHSPELTFCAYKYNFMIEGCLYVDLEGIQIGKDDVWWERSIGDQNIKFLNPRTVYEFKTKQREKDEKRVKEEHDFEILKKYISSKEPG